MSLYATIPYDKPNIIDTFYRDNKLRKVSLEKAFFSCNGKDQFFVKIYNMDCNGNYTCEGYIYFYLDDVKKESSFIGIYVKPEYRSLGLASLLVSYWLQICMHYDYCHFTTNKKQRKPFLLYLLKKMGFEIDDETSYDLSKHTIELYSDGKTRTKYLLFRNPKHQDSFQQGSVYREDNYQVLTSSDSNLIWLDQVILSKPYNLQDENTAYTRSRKKIEELNR